MTVRTDREQFQRSSAEKEPRNNCYHIFSVAWFRGNNRRIVLAYSDLAGDCVEQMELAAGVDKSLALKLLEEGRALNIIVDQEELLRIVMTKLKCCSMPKLTEISCGDAGTMVEIELQLSFEGEVKSVVLTGRPSQSKEEAKKHTISLAFNHLYEEWGVQVMDYSSKVAQTLVELKTDEYVSEAVDSVKMMIRNLKTLFGKLMEMGKRLQEHMQREQSESRHENAKTVGGLCIFVGRLLKRFSSQIIESKNKLNSLDLQQKSYENENEDKEKNVATKVTSRVVCIPSKTFLNYVLSVFGSAKAKYENGPTEEGLVKGTAKFKIPYIRRLKHCGNLRIEAIGGNSIDSEENAAFRSLIMIESDWNVQLLDVNHAERVAAEKKQVLLTSLLGEIIKVGETVKEIGEEMYEELAKQCDKFSSEVNSLPNTSPEDVVRIYRICSAELSCLNKETSKNGYNKFLEEFDKLEMIGHELIHIKIKLGIQ